MFAHWSVMRKRSIAQLYLGAPGYTCSGRTVIHRCGSVTTSPATLTPTLPLETQPKSILLLLVKGYNKTNAIAHRCPCACGFPLR